VEWKIFDLLIFIAGGIAYCITSTYWNKGSTGSKPKFAAAFTMNSPIKGSRKSRPMMMLMRVNGLIVDDFKPAIVSRPSLVKSVFGPCNWLKSMYAIWYIWWLVFLYLEWGYHQAKGWCKEWFHSWETKSSIR